ncbi:nose resistant to fluoxetine protein 6 [Dermacentor silvarum]|uniref:nose resistant to fluoxetine protein 6 n=1 Tax=Dermacentor silvarum TaxID=543639 RepID=UPI00189BF9AF|nr:nose resistant to fluoxetine protein 6 [Dermacentor silvarum]
MGLSPWKMTLLLLTVQAAIAQTTPDETTTLPTTTDEPPTTTPDAAEAVRQSWAKVESMLKSTVDTQLRRLLPQMLRASGEAGMSPECQAANFKVMLGLRQLKSWAIRLLDSTGRPAAGTLEGTLSDFGNYDECLKIRLVDEHTGEENFRGKYCTLKFAAPMPPKPERLNYHQNIFNTTLEEGGLLEDMARGAPYFYHLSPKLGICIPSACSGEDIESLINVVLKPMDWNATAINCDVDGPITIKKNQLAIIIVIGIVVILCILGTILTTCRRMCSQDPKNLRPNLFFDVMKCFSFYDNAQKLFNTKSSQGMLSTIHGIKFLSMCWVVLCHSYIFMNPERVVALENIHQDPFTWSFQIMMNGWLAVDTFFMLGGVTLAYSTLRHMAEHKGRLNIFIYFFHRIFRIVPPLGFTLALIILLPVFGRGPVWHEIVDVQANKCEQNWWQTLLFFANFVTTYDSICLETTWYLQCDMQFYILALAVVLPMYKHPILGSLINLMFLVVSFIIMAVIIVYYNFPAIMIFLHPDVDLIKKEAFYIHWRPYTHYGPYAVGLFLGLIFFRKQKIRFSKALAILGWAAAITLQLAMIYGIRDWHEHYETVGIVGYVFAITHRTAWAATVAYILFASQFGLGGWIGQFLQWKALVPLSRLTFMTYLLHPVVMWYKQGQLRERFYLRHFPEMANNVVSDLVFSYAAAFIGTLLFEVPMLNLEKIILRPFTGPPKKQGRSGNGLSNSAYAPESPPVDFVINGHHYPDDYKRSAGGERNSSSRL